MLKFGDVSKAASEELLIALHLASTLAVKYWTALFCI